LSEEELTREEMLQKENEHLRQLVRDYQAYLKEIAPFSFEGLKASSLRARTRLLLGEQED